MNLKKKIIVLTPVKNEAWILNSFLAVTSTFADHVLIADQNSTDGSLEIYPNYRKVVVIENNNPDFNEAERQMLLLDKARQMYGVNNILLGLSADEILAFNALQTYDWQRMLTAKPGTVLYFDLPSLYKDASTVIRFFNEGWPFGYVDDGAEYFPDEIHSTRIPNPPYAEKLRLHQIKFIHYNTIRLDAAASKLRLYGIIENIRNTKNLRHRLRMYNSRMDASKIGDAVEQTNEEWLVGWERRGIEVRSFPTTKYYWYDYYCLELINENGVGRFVFDDIWNFDWEALRLEGLATGLKNIPHKEIKRPFPVLSRLISKIIKVFDSSCLFVKKQMFGNYTHYKTYI